MDWTRGQAEARFGSGFTGRFAFAYADGDEILPDDSKTPLGSIDPLSLVAGIGYRDPGGTFGGELTVTHNSGKSLESTEGVCAAECFRPDSFTIIDATVFVRPLEMFTLRAGVFNLIDEAYAFWSDIRGLAASSAITDAYTRTTAITTNRHQTSPQGWIHWQDNMKMGTFGGELKPVVQEYVLNTYTRFSDYDTKAADDYWAATKGYWAAIRAKWDEVAASKGGIAIGQEAQTGTVISARLLELADEVRTGSTTDAAAVAEAVKLIEDNTRALAAG